METGRKQSSKTFCFSGKKDKKSWSPLLSHHLHLIVMDFSLAHAHTEHVNQSATIKQNISLRAFVGFKKPGVVMTTRPVRLAQKN